MVNNSLTLHDIQIATAFSFSQCMTGSNITSVSTVSTSSPSTDANNCVCNLHHLNSGSHAHMSAHALSPPSPIGLFSSRFPLRRKRYSLLIIISVYHKCLSKTINKHLRGKNVLMFTPSIIRVTFHFTYINRTSGLDREHEYTSLRFI